MTKDNVDDPEYSNDLDVCKHGWHKRYPQLCPECEEEVDERIRAMRKPRSNDQTEWWVKEQVKKILETAGWKFWMSSADIYGRNGVSDFLAVKHPALFMAIETKYANVVTATQFEFLTSVHEAGHYAFLVDETNIEELRKYLTNELDLSSPCTLRKWQDQKPFDIRISKTKT